MKKVAFFVGDITKEYQSNLIDSMMKEAKKDDVKLFIFANHGTSGVSVFNVEGERSVIQIPDLSMFDGIVIIPDTHEVVGMAEALIRKIHEEATCPVVSIRTKVDGFYNVMYDDYNATIDMVEHFIQDHHFTKIAYMSGTISSPDAKHRLKAFLSAMNKHGLPIGEHRIFYGNYWRNKGKEAVDWFLSEPEDWPEAIICANDYMAISVCDELKSRGIEIPGQISVAGYDDLEEARCYFPGITSHRVDGAVAGKTAMDILHRCWNQEKVEENTLIGVDKVIRASCGCKSTVDENAIRGLYEQKERYYEAILQMTFMFTGFENVHTFEELIGKAQGFFKPSNFEKVYVCLCEEHQKQLEKEELARKYTDQMVLKAILTQEGVESVNEVFPRKDILPCAYMEDTDPIIITTLHERNECLGYVVIKTNQVKRLECYLRNWLIAFSNSICRLKMYTDNQMLEEIRTLYVRDPLTGILNRRGFEAKLQFRYDNLQNNDKGFYFFSLDMDGLKYINDHFGHATGDEALASFAGVLRKTVGADGDCARVGGDEFSVCLPITEMEKAEEFCKLLREKIDEWNEKNKKSYVLSVSIGYAVCSKHQNLATSLETADHNMYIDKAKRKKNRVD